MKKHYIGGLTMALNEPHGMKEHIKIKPVLLEPIRQESYANLPKGFRKVIKFKPVGGYVTIVNVNEISNPQDLAYFVRHSPLYGFGLWAISFFDVMKRHKNYKQYFPCLGKSCRFWNGCKVKKRKLQNPRRYKKCKMNSTHAPNWSSRCWLEITPKDNSTDDNDFNFKLFKNKNQMFRFWFWFSDKHGKKRIPTEDKFF